MSNRKYENDEDDDEDDGYDYEKSTEELIEDFESHESEKIHDFYDDFKYRFPWFIDSMEYHDILNFIIDQRFSQYQGYPILASNRQFNYFEKEYGTEINSSLFVINNFLRIQNIKTYKYLEINYQDWFDFCYNFTTIKTPTDFNFELPEMSDDSDEEL